VKTFADVLCGGFVCHVAYDQQPEIHLQAWPPFYALPEGVRSKGDRKNHSPLPATLHRIHYRAP